MDRNEIHVGHPNSALYDNGCTLCDAIESLHGIIEHGIDFPWSSEEAEIVHLIRYIKNKGRSDNAS